MNKNEQVMKKPAQGFSKYSEDDKNRARRKLRVGFEVAKIMSDGKPCCPVCGENRKGKFVLREDNPNPYWKCHPCGIYGDVFKAMATVGIRFSDAISILLGKSTDFDIAAIEDRVSKFDVAESFVAKVDFEIYDFIVENSDKAKAVEYYAQWHISETAVRDHKAGYITDAKKLENLLLQKFGRDRLFEAGVLMKDKNQKDMFLFSNNYPVIEPHLSPNGHVVGMQFRPSFKYLEKVNKHKQFKRIWGGQVDDLGNEIKAKDAWKKAYLENPELAGEFVPYVPPFMSIRGAGPDSLVGCGLAKIKTLPHGSKVYVVEGYKDLLASNTMDVNAYAIPGTGVMPSSKVCKLLQNYKVMIMLDGDEAGSKGRTNLKSHLIESGVNASIVKNIREGLDVTDILVERHAHAGCKCVTCLDWISIRPFDPKTCPCSTCTKNRK